MAIQVTIVLDSGVLQQELPMPDLTSAKKTVSLPSLDIGFPNPHIVIRGDGIDPILDNGPSRLGRVAVRHSGSSADVECTNELASKLLRWSTLFGSQPPQLKPDPFDTVFHFDSGLFRCSAIKDRYFYEMTFPNQNVGRQPKGNMPHDIAVEFELGNGQELTISGEFGFNWSTRQHPNIKRRFDIEIVADHSSAVNIYRDALDLKNGDKFWLPNQGDPPPVGGP